MGFIAKIFNNIYKRLFLSGNITFYLPLGIFLILSTLATFFLSVTWSKPIATILVFFENDPLLLIVSILTILVSAWFFTNPLSVLKTQFRRNRPSWVWYAMWSLLVQLVFFAFFINSNLIIKSSLFSLAFLIFCIYLYLDEGKDTQKRFAYDAVGKEDDGLNFKSNIKGFIQSLDSLEDCVSVVSLFGDLGHGKSSFLRMAVEEMNAEKFLYTYISLTETNEVKDFSQLFAERWRETLSERYPNIDTVSASNMLRPIIREVSKDFFSTVFNFIEKFNKQIFKTKVTFHHILNKTTEESLDKDTAKMFGNIDEFVEKRWIVVIDELERSKRDEIYRAIEIIERFKTLGSKGLPIKIIFVICTSEKDLKELLEQNPSEPSKQIGDFFFSNPKTFSNYEFIPYPSWEKMVSFIQKSLLEVRKDKKLKSLFDRHEKHSLKLRFPQTTLSQVENNVNDSRKLGQEEVIDVVTLLMANESPRLAKKVIDDLKFVTQRLSVTSMLEHQLLPFPFSQMLLLSFIRVKYPELFVFLHETVDDVFHTTQDKINESMFRSLIDKDKKITLEEWFKSVRGKSTQQCDWGLFERLISMVSYEYLDYLNKRQKDYLDDYINLNYIPYGLLRYLRAIEGLQLPEDADFVVYLKKYQSGESLRKDLPEAQQLYLFARNSRRLYSLKSDFYLNIAKEIFERWKDGRIPLSPRQLQDSIYSNLTYEFLFHLTEAIKRNRTSNKKARSQLLRQISDLLNNFFEAEFISIGAKFTLLNSIVREKRSAETHWDLDKLLKELEDEKLFSVRNVVDKTLSHYRKKYIENKETIYENEENFFYVLYQYWTGDKSDQTSIKTINDIAERNLEKYPDVLELFWDMLPYDESTDIEDSFTDDFIRHNHGDLNPYLTLLTLVNKSLKANFKNKELKKKINYWNKDLKKSNEAYIKAKPLKDVDTLMKTLINKGLVKMNSNTK